MLEAVDITLDALEEGAADVALLPAPDFTLSRALFYILLVPVSYTHLTLPTIYSV